MAEQEGDYELSLYLDGLYYAEARDCYGRVDTADKAYAECETRISEINEEIARIESKYKTSLEAYDETESYCIQLEDLWFEFQGVAGNLIRIAATLHTLCASCLEAHINILAQKKFVGSKFMEFDKLSLLGKWLFYPEITGIEAFDLGREPMQSLKRLISVRNSLVHFKGIKCRRQYGFEVPDFIDRLSLRKDAATKSIETVQKLVKELAKMEKRAEPEWLDDRWTNAILTVTPAFSF